MLVFPLFGWHIGTQEAHPIQVVQVKPVLLPRTKYPFFDIAWALLAIVSIGLFILGWPLRLEDLLFPAESVLAGLEKAGLTTKVWAAGMLGAETILMVVCSGVGIILYFQRRKELVIFLTSLLYIDLFILYESPQ